MSGIRYKQIRDINIMPYYILASGNTISNPATNIYSQVISATTYYNLPTDIRVTGGTYSNGTILFTNNTGGTFNVTGLYTGGTDVFVTGATYSNNTFTYTNNTGGTFNVNFNTVTGLTVNGNLTVTGNTSLSAVTATTISATTISGGTIYANDFPQLPYTDGETIDYFISGSTTYIRVKDSVAAPSGGTRTFVGNVNVTSGLTANTISATTYYNLPTDVRVTGGTYSNGTIVFTNNTGGTFNVTGLYTGYTAPTDVYVTGATYSNNTFTYTNNTGGTFNVSFNSVTGLTVNGDLNVTGSTTLSSVSATTISATTYYNLPTDVRVTGGTYTNGTLTFTNNTGGTFNVTGLYTGYTAPTDVFVTGATYSNNTFTYTNNTGGTFNVNFNTVTGLTVNGNLNVTGNTTLGPTTATTISATTISGGTIYANDFPQLPYTDGQTIDYYTSGSTTYIRVKDSVAAPSGGTRTFVGNVNVTSGFTANTISATTYYNLPTDIRVTGGTYSNGTIVFTNNTGGTFNVIGLNTGSTFYGNVNYIDFNTTATTTHQEGRIHWNDNIKSLEIDTENANVQIQVGHQVVQRVYNGTGGVLTKGTVVYINGEQGQRPTITKADYSADTSSASVIGLVMADINNGANGYIITNGILEGLNTIAYSAGTPLYLYTGGTYSSTKPIAPKHDVRIGKVVVSNATTGSIYVSIQNGYELEELHDVIATGATYGDLLVYSAYSGSDVWVRSKTLTGSYTINGGLSVTGETSTNTLKISTIGSGTSVTNLGIDSSGNVVSGTTGSGSTINLGFYPIPIATSSVAIGTGSNDYYLNVKIPYSLTVASVSFSSSIAGSDNVRVAIYRGQDTTATLVGQSSSALVSTLNTFNITAEVGQNLSFTAGQWMVIAVAVGGTTTNLYGSSCPSNTAIAWFNATDSTGGFPTNPRSKTGTRTSFPSFEINVA